MDSSTELTAHLTTGAVVVYGIEWVKRAGWCPWVTADTKTVTRILSGLAAAIVAAGIGVTGDVGHGWSVSIPPAATLLAASWEWIKQVVVQQVCYDAVIDRRVVTKG